MAGWIMHRSVLVVVAFAAALAAAGVVGAASQETSTETSCSVPCGYIYPLIIIEPEESQETLTLPEDGSKVEVPATFIWTFDMANEGFTVNNPTEPIEVTFEFPRKPSWAGMEVEPSKFEVPISPQYVEPEADDVTNPGAQYRYTTDITVRMWQKEQATLSPGEETADLLVFAKSSESGLYKPSYGIKEFSTNPEGAAVEADDGSQDVDAPEVPPFEVPEATRGLGPVDVELSARGPSGVFEPAPVQARVTGDEGGVSSVVNLALVDEDGTLLYATGPRTADSGSLAANLTFPEPGSYRILVTAEPGPGAGTTWTPGTVAFPVEVPGTGNEAVQLPNQYTARYHEEVSEVHADPGDPSSQYEKFIPLPVYDGANGANLLFELGTDNPAAATPSGPANLNVQLLDPNGGIVARGTFDPANPTLRMPVNALPGEGLYQIRVYGQGADADALAGASYDVQVSASYDGPPVVDDVHDGQLAPPGRAAHGPVAVETDHDHHDPWTPQEVSVPVTAASGNGSLDAEAALTILDPDGRQVLSTGWQDASDGAVAANVTFPDLGRYLAAVHVRTPPGNGTHVQPTTLASTLHVGDHDTSTVTLPETYRAEHAIAVPPGHGPEDPYRRTVPVDVRAGAGSLTATASVEGDPGESYRLAVVGPDGETLAEDETDTGEVSVAVESGLDPGRHVLVLAAEAPDGGSVDLTLDVAYGEAITAENPLFAGAADDGSASTAGEDGDLVPATPAAALAGLLGAALALRRRR